MKVNGRAVTIRGVNRATDYVVLGSGDVLVRRTVTSLGAEPAEFFRVGSTFAVDGDFTSLAWLGRGQQVMLPARVKRFLTSRRKI